MTPDDFIARVSPGAQAAAKESGVLASVSIAQGALESGWGAHAPGNNLFGIKADKSWHGPVNYRSTTEVIAGKRTTITAAFRAYPSWAESIADHAAFIKRNPRYAKCFSCSTPELFAVELQKAGYATDPVYAVVLSRLIRQHNLSRFDA